MADRKISELPLQSSPSTSATLAGVDNGETVKIPITEFVTQDEDGSVALDGSLDVNGVITASDGGTFDAPVDIRYGEYLALHNEDNTKNVRLFCSAEGGKIETDTDTLATEAYVDEKVADVSIGEEIQVNRIDIGNNGANIQYGGTSQEVFFASQDPIIIGSEQRLQFNAVELFETYVGPDDATYITAFNDFMELQSPEIHLRGVHTIQTSDGSCGDAGQVLTSDGATVYWGNPSGGGIIDVEEFPDELSTSAIYRKWQVIKAEWTFEGHIVTDGGMTCEVVDTLPETGEMCYTGTSMYSYYCRADNGVYGYVESNLSAMMSVPVGWYPAAILFGALGYNYNGIVESIENVSANGYCVLLTKKPHLYCFHDNNGNIQKSAIITSDNYEFDEATGTLTQYIVL